MWEKLAQKVGVEPTALLLKRLREAAKPPISIRRMADLLGMESSTDVFYERPTCFKRDHVPIELARRIAAILADRGVDPAEVMALAGVDGDASGVELSAGEEQLLGLFRAMEPERRQLLLKVARAMKPEGDPRP